MRGSLALLRVLVLALALPLGLSSSLGFYARVVFGPSAHVCSCRGAHSMTCPVCNPAAPHRSGAAELTGAPCGSDPVHGSALGVAVLPAPDRGAAAPRGERRRFVSADEATPTSVDLEPTTPPPRA